MIIVGSVAIKYWMDKKGIPFRTPSDYDFWYSSSSSLTGDGVKISKEILDLIPEEKGYATLDALYTIKLSHLGWDIFWQKHKSDALLLQRHGAVLLPELYNKLVEHWRLEHGNKDFLSLYKDKTKFFNDYVVYVYDHDYLHELVAYPDEPVYKQCLKAGHEVAIDKKKFDKLPFASKVRMFREEISVIAAERWLLNPKTCGKIEWQTAYSYALRKTVTALTKNWASDFIIHNLKDFVLPDYSYFDYLFNKLPEGGKTMAKKVENEAEIFNEMMEAYNEQNPDTRYSLESVSEMVLEEVGIEGCEWLSQDGGGEGGGEHCESVFKWKDKIYKVTYSYYSFNGYEFNGNLFEVQPVTKTVTVYE